MKKKKFKSLFWVTLIFVGTSYLFALLPHLFELDLSVSRLHTLSKGSREILRKLPEPVTLKLYYSKTAASKGSDQIRPFTTHFEYTKDLLKLFESYSQNKVKLQVIDPRPDTPEEEEAAIAGLKKFQLTDTETYIFGLVALNQSGNQKVIEFFDPAHADKVEYEVAKILTSLNQGNKKRLGILSAENLTSGANWWVGQVLNDLYTVSNISNEATEIKDIDALMVFGVKGLQEKSLKAVDQYLVNGGKVFFALDPKTTWNQSEETKLSVMEPFFKAWGVSIQDGKFAGDIQYSGVGRINNFSPSQRLLPVFLCEKDCLKSSESPTVASLGNVTLIYPGAIQKSNLNADLKFTSLIQTSEKGNTYEDGGMGLMNPQHSIQNFKEGTSPVVIAARLDGTFPKAYNDTKLPTEKKAAAVFLIADQDFLKNEFAFNRDFFGARPANDNVTLAMNGLDELMGSPDLLQIRSRTNTVRPFTAIQKIQLDADRESVGKVQEINRSISRYQSELSGLASKANENNIGVIQSESLQKQKELQQQIARLKSELREAKRAGREKVENLGSILYFLNVGLVPVLIGLFFLMRMAGRKKKTVTKGEGVENLNLAKTI